MVNKWEMKQIFSPSIFSFLCLSVNPALSMLTYHCTLCYVAAQTKQYIITSSDFKFWASLADDTWLFTHWSFLFLTYNHVALENIHKHFKELSFLHNHYEAPVTSQ
jgi:hypothetical protein